MRKTSIFLALSIILILTVTACGKKPADNTVSADGNSSTNSATAIQTNTKNGEVTYGTEGESVVFTASLDFKLDDSTAWLGIIPTGIKYEKEADADNVDIIYCYASNYDDENKKNYRFEFEKTMFFAIGDGTYDMVLTSSDDENIGKVLLQIGIEIKGETITLDFENQK